MVTEGGAMGFAIGSCLSSVEPGRCPWTPAGASAPGPCFVRSSSLRGGLGAGLGCFFYFLIIFFLFFLSVPEAGALPQTPPGASPLDPTKGPLALWTPASRCGSVASFLLRPRV